ncbi:MAG: molybdate ABC transporter substrate-binding protein [Acidimicrobiales bacterium]|nr:molybdate ABC transporter substrate-binding protein [Acidimicrobiales bacterium]
MRLRRLRLALAPLALAAGIAACGGDDSSSSGAITVFAAASLTDSFNELGAAFEDAHPDVTVTFNFGASSALVTQIGEGAPADVFASADEANMTKLTDAGGNGADPVVFAHNELQIIVAEGNPENIRSVKDLADPNLLVVNAAPQVPIGAYAQQVFDKAGIAVTPVSLEENVKAVVTKVVSGEADAGIVYATDVEAAAPTADGVEIPDELNVIATYPITVVKDSADAATAAAFVDFVTGADGQAILARYGFAPK